MSWIYFISYCFLKKYFIQLTLYAEKMKQEIHFPPNNIGLSKVEYSRSIVVVGANGAGKTRLGTWIEFSSPDRDKVYRISAQKSLLMPDSATLSILNDHFLLMNLH